MPVAEDLAGALDLEVLLDMLGSLVVEQSVGVLLPREDFELESALGVSYVAGLLVGFIMENLNHGNSIKTPFFSSLHFPSKPLKIQQVVPPSSGCANLAKVPASGSAGFAHAGVGVGCAGVK